MSKLTVMHVDPNPVDTLSIERNAFERAGVDFLLGDCRSEDQVAAQAAEVDGILTRGVPLGFERHVDDGCWIYSTTGWRENGMRVFWVAGK